MKTQTTLTNGGNVKQKNNKPELSAADKKLIAEYAAKAAVLRESLKSLSDRKREMHEKAEKAFEAWNSFRVELRGKEKLAASREDSKMRKLFCTWKDLEAEKTLLNPVCAKTSAAIAQFVHAAATIVSEYLLSCPYKNAKFGPKTKEKFTADSEKLLSAFGDFCLYLHFGTQFSGELERYEITISEKNTYNRFCEVVSRYGRKEGEKIFDDPTPPQCDTPEKIEAFFVDVKKAEEEFQAVSKSFEEWREKYSQLLKLSGEEGRLFNVEASAPKFVFETK